MTSADQIRQADDLVQNFLGSFEPGLYSGEDAEDLVKMFTRLERRVNAGKMLAVRRVEETRHHESKGHKTTGSWLAEVNGESVGKSAASLEAARAIEAHPEVAEAFKSGKLSESQAREIASTAESCPEQARDLVELAPGMDFSELRKRCSDLRSVAGSAEDEVTRHEAIRKRRYLRTWMGPDGAGHLEARMTADALGVLRSGLGRFERIVFEEARAQGRRESRQAYMADALIAMAQASMSGSRPASQPASRAASRAAGRAGRATDAEEPGGSVGGAGGHNEDTGGPGAPPEVPSGGSKPLVRITVNLGALLRGHVEPGETCSIPGLGPVPVALARSLLGEAVLELVVTHGTDVTTVVTDSRYVSRALAIALEERDPVCCVPGCGATDPLERDHWRTDYSKDGPTSLDNLARLCPWHHDQKTYRGWRLEGGPGRWRFVKPPDGEHESAEADDPGSRPADEARPDGGKTRSARTKSPPGQTTLL